MSEFDDLMRQKAVALKYNPEKNGAPVIVASGMGYLAEKITETALAAGVPVYEDDSLATLLTQLQLGCGNGGEGSPEGFHWNNVFASELTGPLLVKNPRLLEAVAAAIFARRGAALPEKRPVDLWREAAYTVTEEALRGRL